MKLQKYEISAYAQPVFKYFFFHGRNFFRKTMESGGVLVAADGKIDNLICRSGNLNIVVISLKTDCEQIFSSPNGIRVGKLGTFAN